MADILKMEVPFFQTPNAIYLQGLNIYEISVYIYLCRCGNRGSNAFPSYNDIAKKCGMSRRKAIDTVSVLVKRGLIIKYERDKTSNLYEVVIDLPSAYHAPSSAQDAPPTSAPDAPSSAGDAPKKEPLKKNNIEKEQLKYSEQFLEWFKIYPNQWSKQQSFSNFTKLLKKESFENIMKATRNYITYLKQKGTTDKQYITRSTNFIGQKKEYLGYLDMELDVEVTGPSKGKIEESIDALKDMNLEEE